MPCNLIEQDSASQAGNTRKGGRGELPAHEAGSQSRGQGCDVSLLSQVRRSLASNPQQPLFPDEIAYMAYRKYCRMVRVPAPDFETWQKTCRYVFGRYQHNTGIAT